MRLAAVRLVAQPARPVHGGADDRVLEAAGAPLQRSDLEAYSAEWRVPLELRHSLGTLYNMTPPTQGFASLLILALFDRLGVMEAEGFAHVHGLVEATKSAFAKHRAINLGDARFMKADAQSVLDDAGSLDAMAVAIDMKTASLWPRPTEPGDTTWFAAADSKIGASQHGALAVLQIRSADRIEGKTVEAREPPLRARRVHIGDRCAKRPVLRKAAGDEPCQRLVAE